MRGCHGARRATRAAIRPLTRFSCRDASGEPCNTPSSSRHHGTSAARLTLHFEKPLSTRETQGHVRPQSTGRALLFPPSDALKLPGESGCCVARDDATRRPRVEFLVGQERHCGAHRSAVKAHDSRLARTGGTARWHPPHGHCGFARLANCPAARFPGALVELQAAVLHVEQAPSLESDPHRYRSLIIKRIIFFRRPAAGLLKSQL